MTASKYSKERKAFGKQIGEFGLIKEKLAEIAIQIFAAESILYRTAGDMEAATNAAEYSGTRPSEPHEGARANTRSKSAIAKVYGSEMLDFVVDEAVQIFGGYGVHEDDPVCRAYRDARVNRIFEGTNEINRTVIIQTLLKRATGGQLALIPAARKLAAEIQAVTPSEVTQDSVLADECVSLRTRRGCFSRRRAAQSRNSTISWPANRN